MSATADFSGCPDRYVRVAIFCSGLYRSISLSDVHLTALVGYVANPRSPQSQVILRGTKETGYLPSRKVNTFHVFGQHSAPLAVCHLVKWKKRDRGGIVFRLLGSNRWVEGPSCLPEIPIFPASGLRKSNSSWGFSLSHRDLAVCTNVEITACILERW